jgi:hypothetical protein
MTFPSKDNLCTRFATELILRRSASVGISFSIIPETTRPAAEQEKLRKFHVENSQDMTNFDLGKVVLAAKTAMGLKDDGLSSVFSTDVLRVELSGPAQPHLTIVDLPGLFRAGNKAQSEKDSEVVTQMVLKYMERPRSVILAVVSAKNDFALQEVTKYARQLDPDGERTLGLITKPDTLDVGSDSEQAYFELARNRDVKFRLGWHVLRNRD